MFQHTIVVSPSRVEISEKSDVVSLSRRTETSTTSQQKPKNSEDKTCWAHRHIKLLLVVYGSKIKSTTFCVSSSQFQYGFKRIWQNSYLLHAWLSGKEVICNWSLSIFQVYPVGKR
jgi:hypothetical protein